MSEPITNLADAVRVLGALPMGVDLAPLELSEQQVDALVAAGNRVVNDATHEHLCMCDAWPERCVSAGNYFMGAWDVDGLSDALPAVLALWEQMRGGELLALRARVAELEAERHVTNEALSDAAEALRASKDQPAPVKGRARLDASAAADAEATHWQRLGIDADDRGCIDDVMSATEQAEYDRDTEYRLDAEDDARYAAEDEQGGA